MSAPYLSVVIPAYNEEANIRRNVLDDVQDFLSAQDYTHELILVDDGSTDDTKELLSKFVRNKKNARLLTTDHQGKAGAVSAGMLAATGDIIVFTDFDQATPIAEIDKLLPHFEKADIVIGSRNSRRRGAPLSRIVMARGYMLLRQILLGLNIRDTQCGFKAFKRNVAHDLFRQLADYRINKKIQGSSVSADFDVELLYLAAKGGYRTEEIPVMWHYVETRRVSAVKDSIEGLTGLLRIKLNDLQGRYENRKP